MVGKKFLVTLMLVLITGLAPITGTRAAFQNETIPTATAPSGVLAEFELSQLPSRHAEVWFMRISLQPGDTFPMWWKSGIMLFYVEASSLSVEAGEPIMHTDPRLNGSQQLTALPGDSFLAAEDVLVEVSSPADEAATFLMVLMIFTSGNDETERAVDDPSGYTLTRLAYGTAEFQPGPVTITLDRISVSPGEMLESPRAYRTDLGYGWMGLDAGTVEAGTGRATILHRSEQGTIMRPDGFSPGGQYPPIKFEKELTFPAGWGYFFYNAELTWTSTGDEPLTILRVIVTPHIGD